MKPIYIKMSAFGSYASEETVEFVEVNQGIFLITGDTGAGKTTIFDAITYALYDETSGGRRNGEMMRSQFAKEDIPTFVELKFIYNNEIYVIKRSPKQNRLSKKKNKDGEYTITVEQPNVELILPDGLPYRGKSRETNQRIVEIVGLDVNQFTQIAMIAQGDFLKLLHAPSKERKEIFAKIFNTKIFWKMEEELRTRSKELWIQLEDNKKGIVREFENVQLIENSAYQELWATSPRFLESDYDKLTELVASMIAEAKAKEEEINHALAAKQKESDRLLAEFNQAKELNELFASLKEAEDKKLELDAISKEMLLLRDQIELAQKAAVVLPKEASLIAKQKEVTECRGRNTYLIEVLEQEKEKLSLQNAVKLAAEDSYLFESAKLDPQISSIREQLPKYEQLEQKVSERKQLMIQKSEADARLIKIDYNINLTKERQTKIGKEQEYLKNVSEQILNLSQTVDNFIARRDALEGLIVTHRKMINQQAVLEREEASYQTYEKSVADLTNQYEIKYHQFIEGQAGLLAENLREGEPCPVCGATSHPHITMKSEILINQSELSLAKKELDNAITQQNVKRESLQEIKQEYLKIRSLVEYEGTKVLGTGFSINTSTEEMLLSNLLECKQLLEVEAKKLSEAKLQKQRFEKNEDESKRLTNALEILESDKIVGNQLAQQIDNKLAAVEAVLKNLKDNLLYENKHEAVNGLKAMEGQLKELERTRTEAVEGYQHVERQVMELQGKLKIEEENLVRLTQAKNIAEADYQGELHNQGFSNESEYQVAIIVPQQLRDLSERFQNYLRTVEVNESNLKIYRKQTSGKNVVATENLKEQRIQLEEERERLGLESKTVYGIKILNEAIHEKVGKLYKQREGLVSSYNVIKRLDATANGKLSQKHINFQTYIQRRYFNLILREANKRLFTMSGGQFILKCKEVDELSGQGEVGLDLDIYSMVNDQTRDVKTLSGGESFMAALAMALGMADIIQNAAGKIHIDTMFIDEGFGSLSDEARMQAIHILHELSGGNRLVGIISHVTELKAQIGTKLIVTKGEKGSKVKWEIGE